jgi:hypothetical protein
MKNRKYTVDIETCYGLESIGIEVRFPTEAKKNRSPRYRGHIGFVTFPAYHLTGIKVFFVR